MAYARPSHDARERLGAEPRVGSGIRSSGFAHDQRRRLAQIDDGLDEALEGLDAAPLPEAGEAGVVRKRLVQGVAEGVSGAPD